MAIEKGMVMPDMKRKSGIMISHSTNPSQALCCNWVESQAVPSGNTLQKALRTGPRNKSRNISAPRSKSNDNNRSFILKMRCEYTDFPRFIKAITKKTGIGRPFSCPERESNPHVFKGHWILSPARLPIPPSGLGCGRLSAGARVWRGKGKKKFRNLQRI